jgi:Ca-activated chloride channel family protein
MQEPNKLPLVQQSLDMLLDELDPRDTVAIVTYAGYAGTALEPTPVSQKAKIRSVIDGLGAGGSTAGAEGIRQAYNLAEANFEPKRRQSRDPGDRRRFQRRHHQPGGVEGLYRARAR